MLIIFFIAGFTSFNVAYAQGVATSGGVDVDGSWYAGEGLKQGDYFHYRLCQIDLDDCSTFEMKIWVRGDSKISTETVWDFETVVLDHGKIIKGDMKVGKVAPEPLDQSEGLFDYAIAFKSSIVWLSAFATSNEGDLIHGPKEFRSVAWGKVGAIGGAQLTTTRVETITVPAGTFDTIVVGWYSGDFNEIWVVDDFPFPVKANVWTWVTTGIAPIQYTFQLLEYKENISSSPFLGISSTPVEQKKLGCPQFYDFVGKHESTDTFSMIIEYNFGPERPIPGCDIEWKVNFKNKFNDVEHVDQVHYDIVVLDDAGFMVRSIAQEEGKLKLYNGFGQLHKFTTVKESPGIAHYAIVIYGTGDSRVVPSPELSGILKIDIDIAGEKPIISDPTLKIPSWIKNNAKWWADGQIDDNSFVQGIQYMINQGIMKIPTTSQGSGSGSNEIPSWIKNNAGWWSDGQIDDKSFVQGIQWLIEQGIMRIS